jgi:hypothetical protein
VRCPEAVCIAQRILLGSATDSSAEVTSLLTPANVVTAQRVHSGCTDAQMFEERVLRSEKIAMDCLKLTNWSVEAAIDHFFTTGLSSQVKCGSSAPVCYVWQTLARCG